LPVILSNHLSEFQFIGGEELAFGLFLHELVILHRIGPHLTVGMRPRCPRCWSPTVSPWHIPDFALSEETVIGAMLFSGHS